MRLIPLNAFEGSASLNGINEVDSNRSKSTGSAPEKFLDPPGGGDLTSNIVKGKVKT